MIEIATNCLEFYWCCLSKSKLFMFLSKPKENISNIEKHIFSCLKKTRCLRCLMLEVVNLYSDHKLNTINMGSCPDPRLMYLGLQTPIQKQWLQRAFRYNYQVLKSGSQVHNRIKTVPMTRLLLIKLGLSS